MSFYLLEIFHEEIPSSFIDPVCTYLKESTMKQLGVNNLSYKDIQVKTTPRRLSLYITELDDIQRSIDETITGPPAKIAFNSDNSLSDIGNKFVVSKGIDLKTVKKITTDKGEYLEGKRTVGGVKTDKILQSFIPTLIKDIPFAKSMKWGSGDYKFARPIHTILSIYNSAILPIEIANIAASNKTAGHRFLAPNSFEVKNYDDYISKLENSYVILDNSKRRDIIEKGLLEIASNENYDLNNYDDLLDIVTNLVEYPSPILASFDKAFLTLPKELLITTMKVNQRFFPLFDKSGNIANYFIGVSNMLTNDPSIIRSGYERVLAARLNDALFFYNNDLSVKLLDRLDKLKNVTYHDKLGSIYAKVERFTIVAKYLAEKLAPDKLADIETICKIAKTDLLSDMVYEFPDLQGIMGSYYASHEGYADNISTAIREHYEPKSASDNLPASLEGKIVSIADKIDTIVGIFAIGMQPTGNTDPYALRRSAIGILNIILDANLDIDLSDLIAIASKNFELLLSKDMTATKSDILTFIMDRYKNILVSSQTISPEIFDSVISNGHSNPIKIRDLTRLLYEIKDTDNFQIIVASFKRINNILKRSKHTLNSYDINLLQQVDEKALISAIATQKIESLMAQEDYKTALAELLLFAPLINNFFDNVMVMDDDENIRNSRLGLIGKLKTIFLSVTDFDRI